MAWRTTGVKGIDENECTTTPDYQLIDEGQKITEEGQPKGTYVFSELWMHELVCRTNSTYFFRITHAEEEGLAESRYEWGTRQEHSGCDLLVKRTSAIMVHGIGRMRYHGPRRLSQRLLIS